jgi:hypothetical protein
MSGNHGQAPGDPDPDRPDAALEPRTWLERLGLAGIAAVLGALLFGMTAAALAGGELILAAMSFSGAVLTIGVGLRTLIRG